MLPGGNFSIPKIKINNKKLISDKNVRSCFVTKYIQLFTIIFRYLYQNRGKKEVPTTYHLCININPDLLKINLVIKEKN